MPRSSVADPWTDRWTDLCLVAIFWLIFVVPALLWGHVSLDGDSLMRLAQVRDLLHGQNWFDTSQYRMNTPFGLSMHWSRLVDGPIAALIALSGSERFALTIWPAFALLAVLAALARIARHLAGQTAMITVLVLGLLAAQLNGLFAPGAIDHHNIQLALMLWTLAFLIERRPCATAVTMMLSLAIGLESLPYCAVVMAAASWWLGNEPARARAFGFTLAAGATILLFTTTAAQFRFSPACDSYSLFYAVLLTAGGAGLGAISFLPRHKLLAFVALVAALAVLAMLLNPVCLAGPYGGMDPALKTIWLSRISEAHSAFSFATSAPTEFFGAYVYGCFALAACFLSPQSRKHWPLLAMAAMALLVASFQIRAAPFAIGFALPGLAAALSGLRMVPMIFGLVLGSNVSFALAGDLIEGSRHQARDTGFTRQLACSDEKAMAPLKALAPGRVAGFIDQGPAILAYTGDAAIAGPYHRGARGILDSYAIFTGPDPRSVLKARGIDYVMTCSASPDWQYYRAKGGLIAEIAAHRRPPWLIPSGTAGDVVVYRVAYR